MKRREINERRGSMEMDRKQWKRVGMAALTAFVFQGSFFGMAGDVKAQELSASQDLLEFTAQELQAEASDASYAHLKIGDWLDYGDYGIERTDIPGTDYLFYITTKDDKGDVINDTQLAYCVQSYFLTPLPGEHSADMTDNVSSIGGSQNLHKVIYYGYGGAGYDRAEFEAFLEEKYPDYFVGVYTALSAQEQEELSYILTHGAASYAYFTDGTPLEEYLKLQFELRYGDGWEGELERFVGQQLELAGIENGDLDLMGATYGMNREGIAMSKDWYDILTGKKEMQLSMVQEGDTYTFSGNPENTDLTLTFAIPEDFTAAVIRQDGKNEQIEASSEVTLLSGEQISFAYTGEAAAAESGALGDLDTVIDGTLTGTEKEAWNLVVLQTSKGTAEKITKRQQDIAGVSLTDAGQTELDFTVAPEKGAFTIRLEDEEGLPVSGAVLGVYYDEEASVPLCTEDTATALTTDENGEAYLEFAVNQQIKENDGKLYVKQESAPTGNVANEEVYEIGADQNLTITNTRETTTVSGTVEMKLPDGISVPDELTVKLQQDGEEIDSKTITENEGWSYEWSGLPKYGTDESGETAEHAYDIEVTAPDGYAVKTENGKIVVHEAKPAELVIEAQVNLKGRSLKDGEFTFELTQVTDETGKTVVPEGITRTAVNDAQGRVVFDEITCPQAGTYYFTISSEDESHLVKAEVKADPADRDQLAAEITYPNGEPQFEKVYEASGEAKFEGIRVVLENAELTEGAFTFELQNENGDVLQTGTNDAEGNIVFEPIAYTQDDIGKEYVYTIVQSEGSGEDITYDSDPYTLTVKVEDSENSDGTLKITVEAQEIVFKNSAAAEAATDETATEQESSEESNTEKESAAEGTTEEAESDTANQKPDTEAVSEGESEVSDEKGSDSAIAMPLGIAAIVLVVLAAIVWYVRKKKTQDK